MSGIDRNTGKLIEEPAHIRQGIETILTTPIGARVMRRDFGFDCIEDDGIPKRGVTKEQVEQSALAAIRKQEPRIRDVSVKSSFSVDGTLTGIEVDYYEIKTGDAGSVLVQFNK